MKPTNDNSEAVAKINGKPVRLKVTLDALIRLEEEFGTNTLAEVNARISNPSTSDLRTIVAALSEAAGNPVPKEAIGLTSGMEVAGLIVAISNAFKASVSPPKPETEKPVQKSPAQKPVARRRPK